MDDLRHLLAIYVHAHQTGNSVPPHIDAEARAVLAAEPPAPDPAPDHLRTATEMVGDSEREELADRLGWIAAQLADIGWGDDSTSVARAAALLREPAPAPVAVSERPWEREGWCDAEGRCWLRGKVEGDWRLMYPLNSGVPQLRYAFDFSLPHWAIPQPRQGEEVAE